MTEKTVKIFPNMYFGLTHCYDEVPDNNDFKLHNHDDVYEIVLFLSGDSEFYAEGNVYKLKPYDMLITRPFEMHHIRCLSAKPYERIILYLSTEYFKQNRCEEFEDIFINRPPGTGNLIPSDIVKDDLLNPINRISVYIHNGSLTAARCYYRISLSFEYFKIGNLTVKIKRQTNKRHNYVHKRTPF